MGLRPGFVCHLVNHAIQFQVELDQLFVKVATEMNSVFGVTIEPKNWTRDWLDLWESLKGVIKEVDIQDQLPLSQVIHSEND